MPRTQHADAGRFAQQMAQQCVASKVGRLHRIVARHYELALAPSGLTPPQLEILAALALAGDPTSPSALAAVLMVERSTMSRNLALMTERGWVVPAAVSATGRTMTVAITGRGRSTFLGARDAWNEAQRSVAEVLGAGGGDGIDAWLPSGRSSRPPGTAA